MERRDAMTALIEHVQELETVTEMGRLEQLLTSVANAAGFDWFAGSVIRPTSLARPAVTILGDIPIEWRERYVREGLLMIDPVVAAARRQIRPIMWQALDAPDDQMVVMDAAYDIGLRDGVSFPLRGPHGERGALSFIRASVGVGDVQRVTLGVVVPYALDAMLRCSQQDAGYSLTLTEQQCLFWAAAGKKTDEIGIIMGVPPRTVTYHIGQAQRKLGAGNRDQAVAYAVLRGIITPGAF